MSEPLVWLFSMIFWTTVMSFFSTQEMACISYNRLKLEALARRGHCHAIKIKYIVENPLLLFGTTLFGVNLCLVFGSESARQLFHSLNMNPALSAIVHIPYVLILGELVPMFAARMFPEHMAHLGAPILWKTSRIFSPILSFFSICFQKIQSLLNKNSSSKSLNIPIQLDELQEILQENIRPIGNKSEYIGSITSRIFSLREKLVSKYMIDTHTYPSIEYTASIERAITMLRTIMVQQKISRKEEYDLKYIVLKTSFQKIIGAVATEDLFNGSFHTPKKRLVHEIALRVSYSPENISLSNLFATLSYEQSRLSFIVNKAGEISGLIPLEIILEELFPSQNQVEIVRDLPYIEKTISGDEKILEFFHKHGIPLCSLSEEIVKQLMANQGTTFSQFCEKYLQRKPNTGDMIQIGQYTLAIKETSLLGVKTIFITT